MKRMMMNLHATVLALLYFFVCTSCSDELDSKISTNFEEGLPATVSLKICPADVTELTRADADDPDSYISDLYIAVFDKNGDRIFSKYYEDVADNDAIDGDRITMKLTSTADVKILAIANLADENKEYVSVLEKYYTKLSYLKQLNFQRIDPTDVNHYSTTYLMSGWYAESKPGTTPDICDAAPVDITPGENALTGAIYLRRVVSHNTFRLKAGENISLKINTWQVCNVPTQSYMFEHASLESNQYASFTQSKQSHTFATETDDTGTYKTFQFYQMENKHTACAYAGTADDWVGIRPDESLTSSQLYADREREYKTAEGTNSGIYKSLMSTQEDAFNNKASYVVVNADIEYYIEDTEENRLNPGGTQAVAVAYNASAKLIHRTANVDYTIHLGYCDGDTPLEKAQDFNCFRNTKYTYNVTINGVNNVVVEALREGENEPGAEGNVYDAYASEINLDSHYCEFNIDVTDEERAELAYRITAPYGDGSVHQFYVDGTEAHPYSADYENSEFFTWIKILPTTDEYTLAEYDPVTVWSIEQMRHPDNYPNDYTDSSGKKWYTVFIDEYVYHHDDSAPGQEDSWPYYVNIDNRTVEVIRKDNISTDGESRYAFCKFVFSQKAIQTFYNTASSTALGVEHTDETFCLNITWGGGQSSSHSTSNYSFTDGAYNLWNFVGKRSYQWSNVIDATTPCVVNEDENTLTSVQTRHEAAHYPIYQPRNIGPAKIDLLSKGYPSPNDTRIFYGNGACMSRNRDLNHDGVIQVDEVRWYLATSSEYMQIAIGQGELPDPLMQFGDQDRNVFKDNSDREGTYYYHYLTSDYQYFWAEQGLSVGDKPFDQALNQCYTVRCIRQLGTDRSEATLLSQASPVAATYTHDATKRTFTMTNYNDQSLRGYSAGALAPHTVASVSSRPYRKFEYAQDVCTNVSDDYVTVNSNGVLSYVDADLNISTVAQGNAKASALVLGRNEAWAMSLRHNGICRKYTQEDDQSDLGTWRVPNFKEMAFLYLEGLLSSSSNDDYQYSCTYDFFSIQSMWESGIVTGPFFGYNDNSSRKVLARDIAYQSDAPLATKIKVRCVRDVQE